jgi:hypothetical protein
VRSGGRGRRVEAGGQGGGCGSGRCPKGTGLTHWMGERGGSTMGEGDE